MYLSPRHLAHTELEQDSLSFAERITNIVSTFLDQQKQQTKNVFSPLPFSNPHLPSPHHWGAFHSIWTGPSLTSSPLDTDTHARTCGSQRALITTRARVRRRLSFDWRGGCTWVGRTRKVEVVCGAGRRRFKSRECSIRQERARDGWRTVGRDERVAAGGVRRFGDVVSGGGWV